MAFSQQFPNASQDARQNSRASPSFAGGTGGAGGGGGRGTGAGRTSYVEFYVAPEEEEGGEGEMGVEDGEGGYD